MTVPVIFKNHFFYIALVIGLLFIIPTLYMRVTKKSLFVEYVQKFHKKETSAITPDLGKYKVPRPGNFSAADFVHFKLEFYNAQIGALPKYRDRMSHFVYTRYSVSERQVKEFLADVKNRRQVEDYLEAHPRWQRKIDLALLEARKKKIPLVF